jgi:inosine triphosphate pyrophosphatase
MLGEMLDVAFSYTLDLNRVMKENLYFVTGNRSKYDEAREIIPELKQLDIDLPEIQEINLEKVITVKLEEARKLHKGSFIVEDNSLTFDCLKGLPGPLIKWFLTTIGNGGLYRLAKSIGDYGAEAKVVVGYKPVEGETIFFEGSLRGEIVPPRGDKGFGWDAIFQPEGYDKTFGEMDRRQKNKISMRKIAYGKLKKYLES